MKQDETVMTIQDKSKKIQTCLKLFDSEKKYKRKKQCLKLNFEMSDVTIYNKGIDKKLKKIK